MREHEFSLTCNPVASLLRDIKRAVERRKVEFTPDGLMVIGGDVSITVGGVFTSQVLRSDFVERAIESGDPERVDWARRFVRASGMLATREGYQEQQASADPNVVPDAGINAMLDILFGDASKIATWYQGPFTSNSTPAAGWLSNWAGAGSGPMAVELANEQYDELNRQPAVWGDPASKKIGTSAPTVFTIAAGQEGIAVYGSTLNSVATPAYNATDRVLAAATRFANPKTGLGATDIVQISYEIAGAST